MNPRHLHRCILLSTFFSVAGCSASRHVGDAGRSQALTKIPVGGVAGQLEAEARKHPGKSGFAVLEGNREAFTDRIALADFARKTIDVQYYIWSADTIGLLLADHLIQAADRGVRVRVLLDDVNLKSRDRATAAIAGHPNIEVRVFNPNRFRSMRLLGFLGDFTNLNRRMHNKVMVMDNACAIIGGRNIADHYFGLGEDYNYRDLDLAAVGPIVRQVSGTFDEFWNSEAAVPIEQLDGRKSDIESLREQTAVMRTKIHQERYPFPLENDVATLRKRIDEIASRMVWAEGEVLYDSYRTWAGNDSAGQMNHRLRAEVAAARHSVRAEAAYFILRDSGISTIRELTGRGVEVSVLTNSLVGNDVVAAQAGWSRRRGQVIAAGAKVFELRPDAPAVLSQTSPATGHAIASLHTKALLIDNKTSFVGSFNLDPRSAEINSEIGLLVRSEELGAKVAAFLEEGVRPENAYRVSVDQRGHTVWQEGTDRKTRIWKHDPNAGFTKRLMNSVFGWLPIENQL